MSTIDLTPDEAMALKECVDLSLDRQAGPGMSEETAGREHLESALAKLFPQQGSGAERKEPSLRVHRAHVHLSFDVGEGYPPIPSDLYAGRLMSVEQVEVNLHTRGREWMIATIVLQGTLLKKNGKPGKLWGHAKFDGGFPTDRRCPAELRRRLKAEISRYTVPQ